MEEHRSDREIIIDILSKAFGENPRVLSTIKKGRTDERIRIMANYAYDLVERQNGVFFSSDSTTAMLYYRKSLKKMDLAQTLRYLRMIFRTIRPLKALVTLKREKMIDRLREDPSDYIYVWLLGAIPGNRSLKGLIEVRDHLALLQEKYHLPILIETTLEKMLKLYQYVGFEIYHTWEDESTGITVWFLKRPYHQPEIS
ncbi:MAG: hypothetical protein ACOYXB_02380 [Bacteroidota bacterium]